MCTVTIHRSESTLLVTMNRDEARVRAPEKPPERQFGNSIQWIAPLDSQAGGTWFGANEYALQACLLNRYLPEDAAKINAPEKRPSRGRIIVDLLERGPENNARAWLNETFDPEPYPSFWLVVVGRKNTFSLAWDGQTLERRTHSEPWTMFSSSSWRTQEVLAYRKEVFDDWIARGASLEKLLPAFHLWQPTDRKEWAPLMDREYSATRSITQTETQFQNRHTEMRYWPREHLVSSLDPFSILQLDHALEAQPS